MLPVAHKGEVLAVRVASYVDELSVLRPLVGALL